MVTDKRSKQYKILHNGTVKKCTDGLFRDKNGYIAVALGRYYSNFIGERFIATLDTGNSIKLISCDVKDDKDTFNRANHKTDGSMIELIIDVDISRKSKEHNLSIEMGNFNYSDEFHGNIIKIVKVVE